MKSMIMLLTLLIPFLLMAQNKDESSGTKMNGDAGFWMDRISSDSAMRIKMMDMIMEKTKGNNKEMQKLVEAILDNTEMREMIMSENNSRTKNADITVEPRGMTNGDIKEKEMSGIKTVPRKK